MQPEILRSRSPISTKDLRLSGISVVPHLSNWTISLSGIQTYIQIDDGGLGSWTGSGGDSEDCAGLCHAYQPVPSDRSDHWLRHLFWIDGLVLLVWEKEEKRGRREKSSSGSMNRRLVRIQNVKLARTPRHFVTEPER